MERDGVKKKKKERLPTVLLPWSPKMTQPPRTHMIRSGVPSILHRVREVESSSSSSKARWTTPRRATYPKNLNNLTMSSSIHRRLSLHASALSDSEYQLYTSSLLSIVSVEDDGVVVRHNMDDAYYENMKVNVRETRAWLRGRYSHLPSLIIDKVTFAFITSSSFLTNNPPFRFWNYSLKTSVLLIGYQEESFLLFWEW